MEAISAFAGFGRLTARQLDRFSGLATQQEQLPPVAVGSLCSRARASRLVQAGLKSFKCTVVEFALHRVLVVLHHRVELVKRDLGQDVGVELPIGLQSPRFDDVVAANRHPGHQRVDQQLSAISHLPSSPVSRVMERS